MAEQKQHLRLTIANVSYLLPSTTGFAIEQRENLLLNFGNQSKVIAWRAAGKGGGRSPAYALDGDFRVTHRDDWQRAVFVESSAGAYGVVVDDVYLVAKAQVSPFTPLGPAPTPAGHLFNAAATMEGGELLLVLDPRTFSAYLQSLGE